MTNHLTDKIMIRPLHPTTAPPPPQTQTKSKIRNDPWEAGKSDYNPLLDCFLMLAQVSNNHFDIEEFLGSFSCACAFKAKRYLKH